MSNDFRSAGRTVTASVQVSLMKTDETTTLGKFFGGISPRLLPPG